MFATDWSRSEGRQFGSSSTMAASSPGGSSICGRITRRPRPTSIDQGSRRTIALWNLNPIRNIRALHGAIIPKITWYENRQAGESGLISTSGCVQAVRSLNLRHDTLRPAASLLVLKSERVTSGAPLCTCGQQRVALATGLPPGAIRSQATSTYVCLEICAAVVVLLDHSVG